MGRTVTYTYDSAGDVTSITEPYVGHGVARHDSSPRRSPTTTYGVPTSITDFNGNTTTFVLDSHGNVLEEEQPGGVDQEWTYNSGGQVLTYTDGNGATTSYTYNSLGRLTEIARARLGLADDPLRLRLGGRRDQRHRRRGRHGHVYLRSRWVGSSPSKTRCRPRPARTCRSRMTTMATC